MVRPVFVLGSSRLALNLDDNVNDESGYQNNGVVSGAVYTTGKINNGLSFDGIDDYVSVADADSLDLVDAFSVLAWIYPDSYGEGPYGRIIDKNNLGATGYIFYIRGTDYYDLAAGFDAVLIGSGLNTFPSSYLSKWSHIAVAWDRTLASNQVKFYLNGNLIGQGTRTTAITANALNLYVGNIQVGTRTFDGIIDELYLYDRALSQAEIQAIMNGARVVKI